MGKNILFGNFLESRPNIIRTMKRVRLLIVVFLIVVVVVVVAYLVTVFSFFIFFLLFVGCCLLVQLVPAHLQAHQE